MEIRPQAELAEELLKKTELQFDRLSEEASAEFEQPMEQSMFLIKRMKGFVDSFVYNSGESDGINVYHAFFVDGSWLIFDETGETKTGVCLKKEKVAIEYLPANYGAKFNSKGAWKLTSKP
jgi:hypothetical protein